MAWISSGEVKPLKQESYGNEINSRRLTPANQALPGEEKPWKQESYGRRA